MNKLKKFIPLTLLILVLCSCGQKIDEAQVIENNATNQVTVEGNVYRISGQTVTLNGKVLAKNIGANEEKLVVLGNKVYFNTDDGTKYINKNGKIKDFGKGKIIYAKGQWLYYVNIDLYRVSALDGKQKMISETAKEFKADTEEGIVFTDGEKNYILKPDADELVEME